MLFMFYSFFTMPIGTCGASISSGAVGSTTSKMIHTWQDQATLKASLAGSSSNWHFGLGTARVHAMKHLRVVTLNVGGSLHLRDNCTILAREIEQLECDIVIITETQLGTAGHKHIQRGMEQALEATGIGVMSEYSFISSACAPDYHAAGQGIILCIRKDLIADEIEVIVPGRLLIVTLKANGSNRKINIAALYFPAAGGSTKAGKREAAEILASLQTLKRKRAGKWILAGDLNAVGHPSDRLSARLTRYDKNGPPSVLETAGWKDTWKMKHRGVMNARGVCSWTRLIQPEACQAPIHAARIDAIWVSGGSFNTLKRTCIDMGRILFTAAALDHRAVIAEFDWNSTWGAPRPNLDLGTKVNQAFNHKRLLSKINTWSKKLNSMQNISADKGMRMELEELRTTNQSNLAMKEFRIGGAGSQT